MNWGLEDDPYLPSNMLQQFSCTGRRKPRTVQAIGKGCVGTSLPDLKFLLLGETGALKGRQEPVKSCPGLLEAVF